MPSCRQSIEPLAVVFAAVLACCHAPILLPTFGSASERSIHPYVPVQTPLPAEPDAILRAVFDTVTAHGMTVVRDDRSRGVLVALTNAEGPDGERTRERWRFRATSGALRVIVHSEQESSDTHATPWHSERSVCNTYRYARERGMIREIQARLEHDDGHDSPRAPM
jgi:hypothetical protein